MDQGKTGEIIISFTNDFQTLRLRPIGSKPRIRRMADRGPQTSSDIIRNHVGQQAYCQGNNTLATAGETHLLGGGGLH